MPSWTSVPLWTVGQWIKATTLNLAVTAIGELQNALDDDLYGTPYLLVRNTAAGTGFATIPFNTVVTDTHSGWNTGSNEYTIPKTGNYLAVVQLMPAGTVAVAPNLQVNAVDRLGGGFITGAMGSQSGSLVGVISVTASDVVKVREGGGNNWTPTAATTNFLNMKYLGP